MDPFSTSSTRIAPPSTTPTTPSNPQFHPTMALAWNPGSYQQMLMTSNPHGGPPIYFPPTPQPTSSHESSPFDSMLFLEPMDGPGLGGSLLDNGDPLGDPSSSLDPWFLGLLHGHASPATFSQPSVMQAISKPLRSNPNTQPQMTPRSQAPNLASPPSTPALSPGLDLRTLDAKFICLVSDCRKTFTSRQSLKSHSATHALEKEKPFACSICGESTISRVIIDLFMRPSSLLNADSAIENMLEGTRLTNLMTSDALKRHLQSKAHSLPPELTMAIAAASRQIPFPQYAWPNNQQFQG